MLWQNFSTQDNSWLENSQSRLITPLTVSSPQKIWNSLGWELSWVEIVWKPAIHYFLLAAEKCHPCYISLANTVFRKYRKSHFVKDSYHKSVQLHTIPYNKGHNFVNFVNELWKYTIGYLIMSPTYCLSHNVWLRDLTVRTLCILHQGCHVDIFNAKTLNKLWCFRESVSLEL